MAQQTPRVRAVPEEWVELEHKDIDGTHRVSPRAVAHWETRGWKPVTKKPAQTRAAGSES
ncbi:hypothetical protein I4I73_03265 [Pseudonocardia sp. KRD-184]|uniref:Lsr2 protein n=1 Tax=Pseudonocardia oceani TaxID=2792013 RepID=A0ABS6UG20_9PSEU|nr:hypothetical protein [Pseudonocardia oceani]MBW0088234.1 hypothetical protein [Pseudonocardia oceani]MBW0095016.1 hypothetical protein [Pseudonocardia oceani]MBW0121131.1 hypothetical protein [Pseudonocardia oceani]MBW0131183.1 hypothetical protein [Pseudonocardia oceani]MBW0132555.1 hypothetical protein [Pseudonocardia oceani]